ncbi:non-ribosomal peptide synthetase [Catenulispora rubra]|uniref:non-ribosomal peptide synthetase n=1 Tax=Catenulispora rubra TaxID=280293 RepID=UPI001892214E|nr:non-ribosomal peptide synthetase [Catenulispora rubra]
MTDLSAPRRELAERLHADAERGVTTFPTTAAQRRIWLLHQMAPRSSRYTMPAALRLCGELDVPALQRALTVVAARHEALRTTFPAIDGVPVQQVHAEPSLQLEIREPNGVEPLDALQAAVTEPFDLDAGPLARAILWPTESDEHLLLVAVHHIAADAWSLPILLTDLAAAYRAEREGEPSAFAALPIQCGDYAVWEASADARAQADAATEYWRGALADAPEPLDLPSDRPWPASEAGLAATCHTVIPAPLAQRLRGLARDNRTTMFAVLHAGLAATLKRYTGARDLIIGVPVSGRIRPETAGLVGCFVNTLPLRATCDAATGFSSLLGQLSDRSREALTHQAAPLERIIAESGAHRLAGRAPLFDIGLTVQPRLDIAELFAGLRAEALPIDATDAKFDLGCLIEDDGEALRIAWEYRADLLDAATVGSLADCFATLLAAAIADPARPIGDLPVTSDPAMDEAAAQPETAETIVDLFTAAVAAHPDAAAIVDGDRALTYRDLDRLTNQISRELRGRGVGMETPVGVCLPRSVDFAVACLAVVKAGGQYVPLDAGYPRERLDGMLADAGIAHTISTSSCPDSLAVTDMLFIDERDSWAEQPDTALGTALHPDMLAAQIFTSGSTGRPKAVALTQRGVIDLVRPGDYSGLGSQRTLLWLSSVSFDAATWEIWGTLLHGARGVVHPELAFTAGAIGAAIQENGVTAVVMATALFHAIVDEDPAALRGLRTVFIGGEALSVPHVRRALSAAPGLTVINGYGPAEATTCVTACAVTGDADEFDGLPSIPIGRAVNGSRVLLCDADGRQVPPGAVGELWIGGPGLARGYTGQAALTAERFVPGPDGSRWYRTGDLARRLGDGTLLFRGRGDAQAKIRGHRVEPGEVESVLTRHPDVVAAAVVVHRLSVTDYRLAAYVVVNDATEVVELRSWLTTVLPDYLVPASLTTVGSIPLTRNGKVDPARLPAPQWAEYAGGRSRSRTATEDALAQIWAELLGVDADAIGPDDDFFDLGGHSLLASRLVSRLAARLGVALGLVQVFSRSTLAALAQAVADADSSPVTGAIEPGPRPAPLSYAQERLWFLSRLEPDSPAYHLPLSVRITGPLDAERLAAAWRTVVTRHEALRSIVEERDAELFQKPVEPVAMQYVDAAGDPSPAEQLLLDAARRPFDLTREVPVRALLIQVDVQEYVFSIVVHHIAADGWSAAILAEEIGTAYVGRDLAGPVVQYGDFAHWQRTQLTGDTLDSLTDFWRSELDGAPLALELPTDRARPPRQRFDGGSVPFAVSDDLAERVRTLASSASCTEFMVLSAAFGAMLSAYSGQHEVLFGTPVAGRPHPDVERTVGSFANTVVLRADLSGTPTARQLLARMRRNCLAAFAHQDLPFEKLVETLAPERDLSRNPVVQAMLALNNTAPLRLELPGLRVRPLAAELPVARFDLALWLTDGDDRGEDDDDRGGDGGRGRDDGEGGRRGDGDRGEGIAGGAGRRGIGGIGGFCEYDTALYDRQTVSGMLEHFLALLEAMTADPDVVLETVLTAADEQQLSRWGDGSEPWTGESVLTTVARRAASEPGRAAIAAEDGSVWSYGQLWQSTAAVAERLRSAGVVSGTTVGICAGRTPATVAALLGTWLAGAAYVPLDPAAPAARLQRMAEIADVAAVLADAESADRITFTPVLPLDAGSLTAAVDTDVRAASPTNSPAYILFTSGSTGEPKGVTVPHSALTAFLAALTGHEPGLSARSRLVAVTPFTFDIAALEVFGPLVSGACVTLADTATTHDGVALARLLEAADCDVLQGTPATWRLLLDAGWRPGPGFRALCGGEALPTSLASELLKYGAELWNLYGPTETTVWSTVAHIDDPDRIGIGRPVPGTALTLATATGAAVPIGAAGEIWISGAGVALGYAGRPAATAERFVPADGGGRWYRTGDVGRYDHTGRLTHLGRADAQLKIRGHRVEPGEAEAALITHPAVSAAAVIARDGRLVGYYVSDPAAHQGPVPAALKVHLSTLLPAYLIPDLLLPLAELPLTPHGKLDRAVLAALAIRHVTAGPDLGPRDGLEAVVVQIWSDILGRPLAAVDDFFAAGGHSLDAARASTRLSTALGIEIPVLAVFEHPTPTALADWARARTAGPADPIPVLSGDGPFPLSSAQERLWFLAEYAPESPAYNVPIAARLTGPLDVPTLRRALDTLSARHPALRTVFEDVNGHAAQRPLPAAEADLKLIDLTDVPDPARFATWLVEVEATRPFRLADGESPFRATLIRLSEHEHILVLLLHHIVADGWSVSVLARDLAAAYSGAELPEPTLRHTDYAAWQRGRASRSAGQLTRRREELAGAPHTLELPADRPRPPERRHHGRTLPLEVGPGLTGRIRALAREAGGTEFMVLLAAFAAALTRFSGQEDLLIGTPAANRTASGAADVVGLFAETLVLRADTSGDPTVRELLARVRQACLDAYAAPDVAFETLVEAMAPQRDPARSPLFQVMIALNNAAGALPELPGMRVDPVAVPNRTAKFDVVLNLIDTADGIGGGLEFDTDVYQEPLMARFAEHFLRILQDFADAPDRPLSDISALSTDERQTWLRDFNQVPADYDPLVCLHTLVEAQASKTPDAVAVSMSAERGRPRPSLTYAELDTRANRLAHHLVKRGVQPDDVVGVALPRGIDAVVAQYAVLKAGAGFLPLDPALPPARLADILADAGARLVVTDAAGDSVLPPEPGRVHVDGPEWLAEDTGPVSVAVTPGNLAYVVYTSGSTGRPKGVQIEHRAISNNLLWMQQDWPLDGSDRMLHKTTTTFDVAVKEVFWPLLSGAELVLAKPGSQRDPEYLVEQIEDAGITITHFVPSMLELALEALDAAGTTFPDSLRYVMCGAETLPVATQEAFFGHGSADLLHMYGPTETAIAVTGWTCKRAQSRSRVPLGVPMPLVELYVLDRHGRPVPPGVWGELHVGGVSLGRGYLGRAAETAAAFVPDMLSGRKGARLYRTGDVVRHGPDGLLEFRGRADNQIKIRGFRVELGEIEAALAAEPDVRQAAAVLRGRGADARLIGYAVPAPGESLDPEDLRRRLRGRLPDYMVPADIMVLTAMPLGDNAKVDRAALSEPAARPRTGPATAPRDAFESAVAEVWAETLGTGTVGVDDDFFMLGGNSLQAARIAAQLRERFTVELRLRDVFVEPTVAGIARLLREAGQTTAITRQARRARSSAPAPASQSTDSAQPGRRLS